VPDNQSFENGFKLQWEDFIRHVVAGTPWKFDLLEGAKGVQLAELQWKAARPLCCRHLMSLKNLSINLATIRQQYTLGGAVDACLAHGITAIAPWRDQIHAVGLDEATRIVRGNGMRVTGLCRGGMFRAPDKGGRDAAIDDNRRAIDEAATLNADCLVMVVGGLPAGSRDMISTRQLVADGLGAIQNASEF
jgi:hypothetical protein